MSVQIHAYFWKYISGLHNEKIKMQIIASYEATFSATGSHDGNEGKTVKGYVMSAQPSATSLPATSF